MKIVGYRVKDSASGWIREVLIEEFATAINGYGVFKVADPSKRLENAIEVEEINEHCLREFLELMVSGVSMGNSCVRHLQDTFGIEPLRDHLETKSPEKGRHYTEVHEYSEKEAHLKVYLDDTRPTPNGWRRVYWPDEAIALLKSGEVEEISLDHDLGDDARGTGYDVLLWVEQAVVTEGFRPPKIKIHTDNPAARLRMEAAVRSIENLSNLQPPQARTGGRE
jgi:hypothetical protein